MTTKCSKIIERRKITSNEMCNEFVPDVERLIPAERSSM